MFESNSISFGIALPQVFYPGSVDMALVGSFVTRAEELGFESFWVQERIIGGVDSLEPLNLLSYVAALTQTAKLGTSVLIPSTRNPVMLAKEITTVDHLSNGRLIVGVGLGGRVEQYHLFGAPSERRVGYFLESIEVMKALWQEPVASFEGRYWTLRGETMNPKPVQKPHPPIWIGGIHPNALKRSARYGDGWMGNGNSSTEQFKSQREVLVRAPPDISFRGRLNFSGGSVTNARAPLSGTTEDIIADVRQYADIGVSHITMEVVGDSYSDRFRAMDRFMNEVKPRVEGKN